MDASRSTTNTVRREESMMTDPQTTQPVVEVYWRPGCPYCWMLLRPLRRSGLQLREINIWEDP